MALIRHVMGNEISVRCRARIGRAARSDVQLTCRGASMEHALIVWDGTQWALRDLGSRNGTLLNNRRLQGDPVRLVPNDQIVFGDPDESWRWLDSSVPEARAVRSDGTVVRAEGGLLLLPDESFPVMSICLRNGIWERELQGEVLAVEDGQELTLGEHVFSLDLPTPNASVCTQAVEHAASSQLRVRFLVSADEEHVRITLESNGVEKDLAYRASHYMLLLLGRARLADKAAGHAELEAGWVYADRLAKQLGIDLDALNVQVHRSRRLVARLSADNRATFSECLELVERRRLQLRLGVSEITIQRTCD
jgi:hypothetical protein